MPALGLLLSVLLSFCVGSLNAETIHVPAEQPTIQMGINAASHGDTVLVGDGTYTGDGNKDIDFLGKAVVVMSENGPSYTIIDCEGDSLDPHRGFHFHNGEDVTSVLHGFTIKNGYAYGDDSEGSGGAILCDASSPTIAHNIISENAAYTDGGGINCINNSSPHIEGNVITRNAAIGSDFPDGGGICCHYSSPAIICNMIAENYADCEGGGISCFWSPTTIRGNVITSNSAASSGGAILFAYHSPSMIVGNTITRNTATYNGGAIMSLASSLSLMNNTISANRADLYEGGGISCWWYTSLRVINCILWDNYSETEQEIHNAGSSSIEVTYSDIEGGWEGDGNINSYPEFVLSQKNDYRLLWESPCIDSGHPDSLDIDGTRGDMGAHYFDQLDYLTLYVSPDTTEVIKGEQIGFTYTAINRWSWSQPFWALSVATLHGGHSALVLGPDQYTIPANYTTQIHVTHDIPMEAPAGMCNYRSGVGLPPGIVFDEDSVTFRIVE